MSGDLKEADKLIHELEHGAEIATEKSDLDKEAQNAVGGNPEDAKLNMAEAKVEPDRPELVCKEDILKVLEMDKIGLQKYCSSRLQKNIDLSRRLKQLKLDVVTMIKDKLNMPTDTNSDNVQKADAPVKRTPEFIFNPKNRRVFEWTEMLAKRDDLIEVWLVDENGKRV
ncbi:MAG: hypothetical protein ACYST3_08580 [Planctomycetota bacterium]|jgi:hypothetical protein